MYHRRPLHPHPYVVDAATGDDVLACLALNVVGALFPGLSARRRAEGTTEAT